MYFDGNRDDLNCILNIMGGRRLVKVEKEVRRRLFIIKKSNSNVKASDPLPGVGNSNSCCYSTVK